MHCRSSPPQHLCEAAVASKYPDECQHERPAVWSCHKDVFLLLVTPGKQAETPRFTIVKISFIPWSPDRNHLWSTSSDPYKTHISTPLSASCTHHMAQLDDVPPIKTRNCWERQIKNIPELGQLVDIRIWMIMDALWICKSLGCWRLWICLKKFRSITVDHTRSSKYVIQNLDTASKIRRPTHLPAPRARHAHRHRLLQGAARLPVVDLVGKMIQITSTSQEQRM